MCFGILMAGCIPPEEQEFFDLPQSTTAEDLLLVSDNYDSIDPIEISAEVTKPGKVIPDTTAQAISTTTKFVDCMSKKGAIASNGYMDKKDIFKFGIVGIADKTRTTDPSNILDCVVSAGVPFQAITGPVEPGPCKGRRVIKTKYTTYYIIWAGSDGSVCKDIYDGIDNRINSLV